LNSNKTIDLIFELSKSLITNNMKKLISIMCLVFAIQLATPTNVTAQFLSGKSYTTSRKKKSKKSNCKRIHKRMKKHGVKGAAAGSKRRVKSNSKKRKNKKRRRRNRN